MADAVKAEAAAAQDKINQEVKKMAQELNKEITDGAIEIESLGQQIIIRIREKGAFASGSGFLHHDLSLWCDLLRTAKRCAGDYYRIGLHG